MTMRRYGTSTHKGRGALSNGVGRFERITREDFDDGWGDGPEDSVEGGPGERPGPRRRTAAEAPYHPHPRCDPQDHRLERFAGPPLRPLHHPYRGCEHGCIYCYARPSHAYLGFSPGLDFETRLVFKPDAATLLRAELGKPGYACAPIALGSNTDPYQPVERDLGITRAVLEVLAECGHPVMIVTKSARVERDPRRPRPHGPRQPLQRQREHHHPRPLPRPPHGAARLRAPPPPRNGAPPERGGGPDRGVRVPDDPLRQRCRARSHSGARARGRGSRGELYDAPPAAGDRGPLPRMAGPSTTPTVPGG